LRILVTGASGGIGLPLVRALIAGTESRLRLFCRSRPDVALGQRVRWSAGDLRNEAQLADAAAGADTVLHLAGLTHSNRASEYDAVNVDGTRNVVEASRAAGVRRLVFFSSCVASEEGGAYARSKLRAERVVRQCGLGWIVLRLAEVYGPGQAGAASTLMDWIRSRPVVPILGHGRFPLSPLHIDDLVTAVLEILARPGLARRSYALAGPESISLRDLVDRVAAFHGVRPLRVRLPLTLVRLAALTASLAGRDRPALDQVRRLRVERDVDISAARREIGFRPRSLEEGLAAPEES